MALHAGASIVERLDHEKTSLIDRRTLHVHVHPAIIIPCPGKPLVKDIQVKKPMVMQQRSIGIHVRGAPILPLHYRHPITKVSCIAPSRGVGLLTRARDVMVGAIPISNGTSPFLKVPAPCVSSRVQVLPTLGDVMPTVFGLDRGQPFIKTEGLLEPAVIGIRPIHMDMPCHAAIMHRRKSWIMKLHDPLEAAFISRLSRSLQMMSAIGRRNRVSMTHAPSTGFLMLHPRQSSLSR